MFLVATAHAVNTTWVAQRLWLIVGIVAVPTSVLWAWLSRHVSRSTLLAAALALQAGGIASTRSTAGRWR
jgi:hypothetical protein